MRTNQEIESLLYELPYPFEPVGEGLWVLHDEADHISNIVLHHQPPLLTVRVKVMSLPKEKREEFYEQLLRLNAGDLVHGAYGIDDDSVVIMDTIQSTHLDRNEIQASIDSVVWALTSHYDGLASYLNTSGEDEVSS